MMESSDDKGGYSMVLQQFWVIKMSWTWLDYLDAQSVQCIKSISHWHFLGGNVAAFQAPTAMVTMHQHGCYPLSSNLLEISQNSLQRPLSFRGLHVCSTYPLRNRKHPEIFRVPPASRSATVTSS